MKDLITKYDLNMTVGEWLSEIGFSQYLEKFLAAGYDTLRVCQELTTEDLDMIGVTLPGHKKSIILASKELRDGSGPTRTLFVTYIT